MDSAAADGRSLSNACVAKLRSVLGTGLQSQLEAVTASNPGRLGLTFQDSKQLPSFGWYPYVEGFSAPYVNEVLDRYGAQRAVYDPFGGSGTTQLAASMRGVRSWYSEVNPFMCFVAETKVVAAAAARLDLPATQRLLASFVAALQSRLIDRAQSIDLLDYQTAFPGRDFFVEDDVRQLLAALELAKEVAGPNQHVLDLLRLAVAANAVHASNMTRRADLRRRRADEYKTRIVNVAEMISSTVTRMSLDLQTRPSDAAAMNFVSADCRSTPSEFDGAFEIAITSPPYLNGTNYFRNTKIELWLLGFIASEKELAKYRNAAIAAGINNVNRSRPAHREFDFVEEVATRLDECATDRRIPTLIRHYFSDMFDVMSSVHRVLEPGGRFVFDIGDSKFYGVHVATDSLLERIAVEAGFTVETTRVLARRFSRDKSQLVQRELVFRRDNE